MIFKKGIYWQVEEKEIVEAYTEQVESQKNDITKSEKSITKQLIDKTWELKDDAFEKFDIYIDKIKDELEKLKKSWVLKKINVTKLWSLEEVVFAKNFKLSSIWTLRTILVRLEKFSNDKKYEKLSKLIESALKNFPNWLENNEEKTKQIEHKK